MDFPILIDTLSMGLPIVHFNDVFLSLIVVLILQTVQIFVQCSIMLHFIGVFTVCKSTHLGVSPYTKC